MDTLQPILIAALTGFLSGLLLSIPVGPVNLTILNEGARRGFKWAVLIGLGATAMEVTYCFLAFTGFSSFFSRGYVKAVMELCSFVFLLFLGIKFLMAKSVQAPIRLGAAAEKLETRVEEKFHPHSAFMTGYVRVLGNVGVLVFWVILAANFISREWVSPDWPGKLACVAGVALGTGCWFVGLSWVVSLGHGRIGEHRLLQMERLSGIGLLVLALIHGGTIIWQMHKAQMLHLPGSRQPLESFYHGRPAAVASSAANSSALQLLPSNTFCSRPPASTTAVRRLWLIAPCSSLENFSPSLPPKLAISTRAPVASVQCRES